MAKVIIIFGLIFFAAVAIFGATSDAPTVASNNRTELEKYRIDMEATIAAATPTTGEVLALNRQSLYETSGTADNGAMVWASLIFCAVIVVAFVVITLFQSMADPVKQLRLLAKTVGIGGGQSRRRLPVGRSGTVPTLPSLGGQRYRELPAPAEWSQEVEGYDSEF